MIHFDKTLKTIKDYDDIIKKDVPIIDVRSPIEFNKGSLPNAINLPLMNDDERTAVGICYKRKGHDKAVALGLSLISDAVKEKRVQAWANFVKKHPNAMLMCFRGGMRSRIAQQWLFEKTNIASPRLEGGFKDFRNHLINAMQYQNLVTDFILLGGHTGSGKTLVLNKAQNAIDLEFLARHRGSSFGNYITPQPSQIDFENRLAYALIKLKIRNVSHILIELEGKNIGKVRLPQGIIDKMATSKIVVLQADLKKRIVQTHREYVLDDYNAYLDHYGVTGTALWATHLRDSIKRLQKRFGRERTHRVLAIFDNALTQSNLNDHQAWIEILLSDYYDPMYDYQKQKWSDRILFEGDENAILNFLKLQL